MKNNPFLSVWKSIRKWWQKVPFTSHPQFPTLVILLLIAAAVPFTVFVAQQNQEIRQQAEDSGGGCISTNACALQTDPNFCVNKLGNSTARCITCAENNKPLNADPKNEGCYIPAGPTITPDASCKKEERTDLYKCLYNKLYWLDNVKDTEEAHTWYVTNYERNEGHKIEFRGTAGMCLWKDKGNDGFHWDGASSTTFKNCNQTCWNQNKEGKAVDGGVQCFVDRQNCVAGAFNTRDTKYQECQAKNEGSQCYKAASYLFETKLKTCASNYDNSNCAENNPTCLKAPTSSNDSCDVNAPVPDPVPTGSCNGTHAGIFNNKCEEKLEYKCLDKCTNEFPNKSGIYRVNRQKDCQQKGQVCCFRVGSGSTAPPSGPGGGSGGDRSDPTATPTSNRGGGGSDREPTATPKPKKDEPVLDCVPGEPVDDCSDAKCPDSKDKKCHGHKYCVWDEDGTNYASACSCEEAEPYCSKGNSSSGGSCKDNPTAPPDGYTWKQDCSSSCSNNDNCPKNTKDGAVEPSTSNWCFSGKCLMLVSGGSSSSKKSNDNDKKKEDNKKKKDKKKKDDKKKKNKNDGKTKDDTGNRNKNHSKNDKTDREKAQKPIDKINKQLLAEGKPTLTPLPPDNGPYEASKATTPTAGVSPTPLPALAEPANWQGFCAQTTDATRPWGIRVSWDAVPGATRYAVRIDEDAPSWEGDTPSPGDTVDNQVTTPYYVRQAKPGATYQWWVHTVNASGVYSGLSKKMIIKCPTQNPTAGTGTPIPQAVGAGQLIVLPGNSTAVTTAPTPTTKPTATPTPKK